MRLNKFLAKSGIASRRRSDELIRMAMATVNNEIILDPAYNVKESDVIKFDGKLLPAFSLCFPRRLGDSAVLFLIPIFIQRLAHNR